MSIWKGAAWLTAVAAAFAGGFIAPEVRAGTFDLGTIGRPATDPKSVPPAKIFATAYRDITENYANELDTKDLKYAAMEGGVSAIGDPHTIFFDPKMAEDFSKETQGRTSFSGIGARLQPDPQGVRLVTVFPESPARKSGMNAGDIITAVNGVPSAGKPVDEVVKTIKGPSGTRVKLTVFRPSSRGSLNFEVTRAPIFPPSADSYVLDGTDIGYIQVLGFTAQTTEQFDKALRRMIDAKTKGLVIDMRSNPGGLLEAAQAMLGRFVANKLVVSTAGRDGRRLEYVTGPDKKLEFPSPVVILVNEDSASAAEIFAGVMRDYKFATLVGEHTYGKSTVQQLTTLPDGANIKVTVAKYFLPSTEDIARKVDEDGQYISGGIKPDVVVPLSLGPKTTIGDLKTDNQLQKAVEVIRAKRR